MPGEKIVRRTLADGTVKEYRYQRESGSTPSRSLGALIQLYRASPEFTRLAASSQRGYMRAMGKMHEYYPALVEDLRRRHVIDLRDDNRDTPAAANQVVDVFRVLMDYAINLEWRESNPALKVERFDGGSHRRWTDEEVAQALSAFPEHWRRAIVLGLYTGQREGDVLAMQWSDFNGEGIQVTQEKTGTKLWVPCHAELRIELEAWKREGRSSTAIIVDSRGRPYKVHSFSAVFARQLRKTFGKCGLVYHGLRKTAAAKLAEAGCTPHEIGAITGHKSLAMLELYTREAAQKTMAQGAIIKLENAAGKFPRNRR